MQGILRLLAEYGIWVVFLNVLVETAGIPIPAYPTLILAGALAARGELSGPGLLAAALVASLVADTAWYLIGRRYGHRILKTLCRVSLSPDSCVRQTQGIFERWGMASLVGSKFITGFAAVAPPLAGVSGTGLVRFLAYDTLGILLWAGSGIAAGYIFHSAVERVLLFLEGLGSWAIWILGAALAAFILFKWYQRRRFYRALRMARIGVEELYEAIRGGGEPLVLDVRSETQRRQEPRRVPGARPIAIDAIDRDLGQLPQGREIVLYCT
jgi:membrane protein DedA with SNARE-associated domain